ncbi:LOW QUALITY PROTEIN: MAP6 domain-containing protein 1 [Chiroxiphia lanceolata]|uniref:LOW QUALITY PROTEIN: MAP6 domain-containing protein 1 n=1 Tax=Chiroxiphia lanceolata TaxID=296741 RepID=UPI0013CE44D5|nr:LOW QUALITY PROTEIN: MAP6 domain-containing protein 1 [Chiroxiphia lanceolata]
MRAEAGRAAGCGRRSRGRRCGRGGGLRPAAMAWPCISRVCCLARFWSQLDKSDLSVPLTIHNYSDIEEQEDGCPAPPPPPPGSRAAAGRAGRPPPEPFSAETQYRQDFRAWPLPRRDAFPWVSASSGGGGGRDGAPQPAPGRAACALPGGGGRTAIDGPEQLRPRSQADGGHTTSYRQEYRPWTGAKPSKPIKTKQGFIMPEDHFVQETSYKADFKIPEVKTRFSPNPSAVFQAPSRILNV